MRYFLIIIGVILLAVGAFLYFKEDNTQVVNVPVPVQTPSGQNGNGEVNDDLVRVENLKSGDLVKSPFTIRGSARGNWYFEADFPIEVLDANGKRLVIQPAQAQGEWMTTEFVPFEATLKFTPTTDTGTIILHKNNASGEPQHDDSRRIPVRFDLSSLPKKTIKLYYYNQEKDKDPEGNVRCSSQGLVMVEREVPVTSTPIQDVIRLLLMGQITNQEKTNGIATEFPLAGVALQSASLSNSTLTLTFADPNGRTTGGSCRVNVLRAQIEATAKQFPGVKTVILKPDSAFQP